MSTLKINEVRGLMEAYQEVYAPQEPNEVELWVNSLLEEGYDLSEYTWEDMYEMYVNLEEEYDTFDTILEYLVAEGYANTNEAALAIMTNMSEDWRQSIVEAEVLSKKDGVEGTGVGANFKARAWTDAEKSRYSSVAAKKPSTPSATPKPAAVQSKPSTPSATPKPAAVQSKPQKQRTTDIITPGFTSQDKDGYIAPTAAAKDNAYHGLYANSSRNKADTIASWYGLDRKDPATKAKLKKWADDDYDRTMAIATNDPKYDPKKISYPEFTPRKRTGREAWNRI